MKQRRGKPEERWRVGKELDTYRTSSRHLDNEAIAH